MELKDLINLGFKYYLDEKNNIQEIKNNINILKNNKNLKKKWYFSFFNNGKFIHNNDYNNLLEEKQEEIIEFKKILDNISKTKEEIEILNKIFGLNEELDKDEKVIKDLIKEKSNHFFPKLIYFYKENDIYDDKESQLNLIPEIKKLKDIIINNKKENFLEYFENDENFNFYYTYQDLFCIDNYFKNLNDKPLISNILDKLKFKTYNKIIYLNEYNFNEKLEQNPFRNFKKNLNYNRVITYYNTIRFILYEPIENWLNRQKINQKFKKQEKLKNYLSKIVFYENTMNMFFRFEDLKKKKLMLSLFMKNKFIITNKAFEFENGNFEEIYNILNDYICCEINNEELHFKDKHYMKNLNDFRSYILQKIIDNKKNNDLYLLNFYLNNPKNNQNILISLLNKYKNIL